MNAVTSRSGGMMFQSLFIEVPSRSSQSSQTSSHRWDGMGSGASSHPIPSLWDGIGMGGDNAPSQNPLAPCSQTCSQGDWDGMISAQGDLDERATRDRAKAQNPADHTSSPGMVLRQSLGRQGPGRGVGLGAARNCLLGPVRGPRHQGDLRRWSASLRCPAFGPLLPDTRGVRARRRDGRLPKSFRVSGGVEGPRQGACAPQQTEGCEDQGVSNGASFDEEPPC